MDVPLSVVVGAQWRHAPALRALQLCCVLPMKASGLSAMTRDANHR
jgi:hypothetical protein